jgi:dihydroneopterin aldolase
MDIVYIRELKIDCVIGMYDWEREIQQTVALDLEMAHDISAAAASDAIEDTLNYKAVADALTAFVGSSEFLLVEAMAEQCAALVQRDFAVPWLRLRVSKPGAMAAARDVGVIIERGQRS